MRLSSGWGSLSREAAISKPEAFNNWPTALEVEWSYRAVADRIVDGDTLYLHVDQGLNNYAYESIRLKDVNAPELYTSDPYEKQQGVKARDALYAICPPGTKVKAITEKDKMSFGRYVATLYLSDGTDVNGAMREALVNL